MRFRAKCASLLLLLLFWLAVMPAAGAQQKAGQAYRTNREDPGLAHKARPLTPDEGLAILNAALDSRHHRGFTSDCSHFVHGLYERAGFPYAYAPSPELYAGIDEFRRVTNPQPGDLAVWRGHAGIVVDPGQHSFFSLLRSGPGIGSYNSPYWKRRGQPRFFRYIQSGPGGVFSLAEPQANRDLLAGAGFTDVEIEEVAGAQVYDSLDDYWDLQTAVAGPVSGIIRALPDDERAAIKATLEPKIAPHRADDGGYALPSLAVGISAR